MKLQDLALLTKFSGAIPYYRSFQGQIMRYYTADLKLTTATWKASSFDTYKHLEVAKYLVIPEYSLTYNPAV